MPQNPIQKAHLEGVKLFDEEFPENFEHPRMSKCDCLTDEEHQRYFEWTADRDKVKSFLPIYAKLILNAVKEAGPENLDAEDKWDMGHNSCLSQFHSAINDGIKLIK